MFKMVIGNGPLDVEVEVMVFLSTARRHLKDALGWMDHDEGGLEASRIYDTPQPIFIVVAQNDEICGGARLNKTLTAISRYGAILEYSHPIKDISSGLIPELPDDILDEELSQDDDTWELTELRTNGDTAVLTQLLQASNDVLWRSEARTLLVFCGEEVRAAIEDLGLAPIPLGKPVTAMGTQLRAYRCSTRAPSTN